MGNVFFMSFFEETALREETVLSPEGYAKRIDFPGKRAAPTRVQGREENQGSLRPDPDPAGIFVC